MNYEQMNNNQVQLLGKVVSLPEYSHEVFGENFYEFLLSVKRLSGQEDIIPITVSDRLLIDHSIKINDIVAIDGQFRSYNKLENDKSRLLLTTFVREFLENETSATLNNIEITGYICKQPIYRTTPFKREICDVLVAVNRAYNKSDYIPCILWGRNARFVQTLSVGDKITIIGRIQSRKYVKVIDEISQEKTAYEVSGSRIIVDNDYSQNMSV